MPVRAARTRAPSAWAHALGACAASHLLGPSSAASANARNLEEGVASAARANLFFLIYLCTACRSPPPPPTHSTSRTGTISAATCAECLAAWAFAAVRPSTHLPVQPSSSSSSFFFCPPSRPALGTPLPLPPLPADVLVCPVCAAGDVALAANEDCCCACCVMPCLCLFPCYWAHNRRALAQKYSIQDPLTETPIVGFLTPCLMFSCGCRACACACPMPSPRCLAPGALTRSTHPHTRALPNARRPVPPHAAAQPRQGRAIIWRPAGQHPPSPKCHALT